MKYLLFKKYSIAKKVLNAKGYKEYLNVNTSFRTYILESDKQLLNKKLSECCWFLLAKINGNNTGHRIEDFIGPHCFSLHQLAKEAKISSNKMHDIIYDGREIPFDKKSLSDFIKLSYLKSVRELNSIPYQSVVVTSDGAKVITNTKPKKIA